MEDVKPHYAPYKGTGGFSREQLTKVEQAFDNELSKVRKEFVGPPKPTALERQEGGGHYKDMAIQPVEFIYANGIGFIEGNVIKYIVRYKSKNGVADLLKAKHYIDLLIDLEKK